MASIEEQTPEVTPPETQPQQVVADEGTMTCFGVTLGEIVADSKRDSEEKNQRIQTLEEALALLKAKHLENSFQRLADGSIRLPVTLDPDAAGHLLAQAETAGETPEEYCQKNVAESLLAFLGS